MSKTAAAEHLGLIISVPNTIKCKPQPPLKVCGKPKSIVFNFEYLESMMTSGISYQTRQRALACFLEVGKDLEKSINLHCKKIKLFNTTCVTALLCGCECWVISSNMENKINAFAISCYRNMLNLKRLDCVSNERIYHMTNTQPLIKSVRQCQLHFLEHILRIPEEEPCRSYALCVPTQGRRRLGWQRTSYLSYIHRSFLGMQKIVCTQMQLSHQLQIAMLGESL